MPAKYSALIVDENPNSNKLLASIIRQQFDMSDIFTSTSAKDGLASLKQLETIDWIFCDVDLLGSAGLAFIKEAKSLTTSENAFVILMSTAVDKPFLLEAAASGVDVFLKKPFTSNALFEKLKKIVDGKALRQHKRVTLLEAYPARIIFDQTGYETDLVDLSIGGCMVKSSLFERKHGRIYDMATLEIMSEFGDICVPAQLVRLERNMQEEKQFINAAFIFIGASQAQQDSLLTLIDKMKK